MGNPCRFQLLCHLVPRVPSQGQQIPAGGNGEWAPVSWAGWITN